jgi:multiple sugar transport system permease protein
MAKKALSADDRSYHRRVFVERTVKELICILLCIMSLLPFLILFVNATRNSEAIKAGVSLIPGGNLLENWANFKAKQNGMQLTVFRAMINSFTIAVPSTILTVYFSTMTAYGIQIYDFKLKKAAWAFIMAVMIVPNTISIIGFYRFMMKLNLLDTYIPLIIPAIAAPSTVFFMRQYMQSTFSKELVEAAQDLQPDRAADYEAGNCDTGDFQLCRFLEQPLYAEHDPYNGLQKDAAAVRADAPERPVQDRLRCALHRYRRDDPSDFCGVLHPFEAYRGRRCPWRRKRIRECHPSNFFHFFLYERSPAEMWGIFHDLPTLPRKTTFVKRILNKHAE